MDASQLIAFWARPWTEDETDKYRLTPLGGSLYVGFSPEGLPCVVSTLRDEKKLPRGRETRGLSLVFHELFHVKGGDLDLTAPCAVLVCLDPALVQAFAVLTDGLLALECRGSSSKPWSAVILEYIEEWQDLLARRYHLGKSEELGLWGELYFLSVLPDPEMGVAGWCGPKGLHFDFSANGIDIDVKTSLVEHEHYFSLDQLVESPSRSDRYVYSIWITEDPAGGMSLMDMVNTIRSRVVDRVAFERKLYCTGFSDSDRYEDRYSVLSTKLVRTCHVPRVRCVDPGVAKVRFSACLRNLPGVPWAEEKEILVKLTRRAEPCEG